MSLILLSDLDVVGEYSNLFVPHVLLCGDDIIAIPTILFVFFVLTDITELYVYFIFNNFYIYLFA